MKQDWTGQPCPHCQGTGEQPDQPANCLRCAGTGDEMGPVVEPGDFDVVRAFERGTQLISNDRIMEIVGHHFPHTDRRYRMEICGRFHEFPGGFVLGYNGKVADDLIRECLLLGARR